MSGPPLEEMLAARSPSPERQRLHQRCAAAARCRDKCRGRGETARAGHWSAILDELLDELLELRRR